LRNQIHGGINFMRKALMLVLLLLSSGLFLYGCGSGGSNNPVATNPGGGSQPSSANAFTLNLADGVNSLAGLTIAGVTPPATDVRVVIRQFAVVTSTIEVCQYDDNDNVIAGTCVNVPVTNNTEVYRDIQDVAYPATGSSVQVGIPAGTYTLDVITSKLESGNHSIVKYGQIPNVVVAPGGSASVIMKTVNDVLHMTVADSVTSKGTFYVTLNNALPFSPNYKMTMSYNDGIDPISTTTLNSTTSSCTFTAPASFIAGTISLQGQFTLNPSFLNRFESPTLWTRLFPNAAYGEQVTSTLNPLIAVTVPVN
jgi:hypothetical protein